MVMFLYRDEYYTNMGMNTEGTPHPAGDGMHNTVAGLTEVIIGKNRHGETGSAFAKFVGQYSKFVDLEPEDRMLMGRESGGGFNGGFNPNKTTIQTLPSRMNSEVNPFEGGSPENSWGMGGGIMPNIDEDF